MDVGGGNEPLQLECDELARWFHDHGAVDISVLEPTRRRVKR
jgi:hypothetical protein